MKKKTLALSAVLVAGLLSLAVFAVVGIVQNGPPAAAATVLAQSEPELLTDGEWEEFVQDVCNHSGIMVADINQTGVNDEQLFIKWEVEEYEGPHVGPRFENWHLTYRIERTALWEDVDWELVENVKELQFWQGKSEDGGHWTYRVKVYAVSLGDRTMRCVDPYISEEIQFYIRYPLTAEEVADFRQRVCSELEIIHIEGSADWNWVSLHWETNATEQEWFGHLVEHDTQLGLRYRVERQDDGEDTWQAVGSDAVDFDLWAGFAGAWEGDAGPGKTFYRVALVGIIVAAQVHPCQGGLHWSDVVTVQTPTVEERENVESERAILVAEATRCAQEAFTRNVSEEAVPIVHRYVEEMVVADVGQHGQDITELVGLTVTMCSLTGGNSDEGTGWAVLMLLDLFAGSW